MALDWIRQILPWQTLWRLHVCSGLESAEKFPVTPHALNKAWKVRPVVTAWKTRELVPEKHRENTKGRWDGSSRSLIKNSVKKKSQKYLLSVVKKSWFYNEWVGDFSSGRTGWLCAYKTVMLPALSHIPSLLKMMFGWNLPYLDVCL